jgi:hypothetical protein
MLIEACQEFARRRGFKAVKVAKADSLFSYHNPSINPMLLADGRDRAVERIRRDMSLLYDANAQALGFASVGDWFEWINPETADAASAKAADWVFCGDIDGLICKCASQFFN